MAAKATLCANPARAAALDQLNAPVIERRRMAYLQSLALDIANKKQITPAEAINEAAKTMAQLEANVAFTGGPVELAGGEGLSG
jgi:hypothetical protein